MGVHLLHQPGDEELETDDHHRIGQGVELHGSVGVHGPQEERHEVVELNVEDPKEADDDEEKDEFNVSEDDEYSEKGLSQRFFPDFLAVLPAVAHVLRLFVEEEDKGQADQGEDGGGVGEDGRDPEVRPDEIRHAAAGDRTDVDDHVEDPETDRGQRAGCLLHRAGDAGFDDGPADADKDDGQDDGDGVIDRLGGLLSDKARPESLEVAHREVAETDQEKDRVRDLLYPYLSASVPETMGMK